MTDDLERRLRKALSSESRRAEADASQDIHRVKGEVMIRVRRRNRFHLAIGGGVAVAAVAALFTLPGLTPTFDDGSVPPGGGAPESSRPSVTPSEDGKSGDKSVSKDECADLPFEPSYLPKGWDHELHPGEGGQTIVPLKKQIPQAFGHWRGSRGHFIDVFAKGAYYVLPQDADRIRLFGGSVPARSGSVEDGYSVEFKMDGCAYSVMGFGIDKGPFDRVVEGLRRKG